MCSAHLQLQSFLPCKRIRGTDLPFLPILPTSNYFLVAQTPADDLFVHKASIMDLQALLGPPTTVTVRYLVRSPCKPVLHGRTKGELLASTVSFTCSLYFILKEEI